MISKHNHENGFTIIEVVVASTMAAIIMAAVLSSFVFMGRNLARLANYQSLEAKSREAMTYLRHDISISLSVKVGTNPTTDTLTLVLPNGEVTYSYDSTGNSLRRQATFGANRDFNLLKNDYCHLDSFAFGYYTITGGAPLNQLTPSLYVPLSIKQIDVSFTVSTPSSHSTETRATYSVATARYLLRNKQLPDGN